MHPATLGISFLTVRTLRKSPSQFEAPPGLSHRAIQCCKPRRSWDLLNATQLAPELVQRRPTTEPLSRIRECAQIISGGLKTKSPSQTGRGRSQILQNGANDQSSACETIFEVSTTSVLVLLRSCQSRLQREWAQQDRVYSKPDLSSVAPLILPEVSPPFAQLFLAVPVALFWLWVFVLWISAFLINLDFLHLRRRNHPILDHHTTIAKTRLDALPRP